MYVLRTSSGLFLGEKDLVDNIDKARLFETKSEAQEIIKKENLTDIEIIDRFYQQQEYMDKFYEIWNSNGFTKWQKETNDKDLHDQLAVVEYILDKNIVDEEDLGLMIFSVVMGNLNYQVENGGIHQYTFNNYWRVGAYFIPMLRDFILNHQDKLSKDIVEFINFIYKKYFNRLKDEYDEPYFECTCDECGGSGTIYDFDEENDEYIDYVCCQCGGSGHIQGDAVLLLEETGYNFDEFDNTYYNWKPEPLFIFDKFINDINENKLNKDLTNSLVKYLK